MHNSFRILHIAPLLVFSVLTSTYIAHANPPAWVERDTADIRAFHSVIEIPAQDILVPTVLEVPVPTGYIHNRQAIAVSGDALMAPALVVSNRIDQNTPVTLSGTMPGVGYAALTDNDLETSVDFSFEEGVRNLAYVTIVADEPITTSEVRLALAPNVSLPRTVSIQTTEGEMITSTLVATRPLESTIIRFPETTAQQFTITFECVQPLRLAELTVVQSSDADWTEAVRFLAQPKMSYRVYLDPDRAFGVLSEQGAELQAPQGVREVSGILVANPAFSPSDFDTDGIPDERDNCVQVVNPDQVDLDRNARGDACDDFDRDRIISAEDNCPEDPNWGQEDTDTDGIGDVCDQEEDRFTERNPWVPWVGMGIAALVLIGLFVLTVRGQGARRVVLNNDAPDTGPTNG